MIAPCLGPIKTLTIPVTGAKPPIGYACSISEYSGRLAQGYKQDYSCHVGVDPGTRNLGLAVLHDDSWQAWEIVLDDYPSYAWGLGAVRSLMDYLVDRKKQTLEWQLGTCVVEAAAISRGRSSSTTGLESIRAMAALAFADWHWHVETVRPNTAYKHLWGRGTLQTYKVWTFAPNAATALGLAVLAAHWKELH